MQETKWLAKALAIYKHMPCMSLICLVTPVLHATYTHTAVIASKLYHMNREIRANVRNPPALLREHLRSKTWRWIANSSYRKAPFRKPLSQKHRDRYRWMNLSGVRMTHNGQWSVTRSPTKWGVSKADYTQGRFSRANVLRLQTS